MAPTVLVKVGGELARIMVELQSGYNIGKMVKNLYLPEDKDLLDELDSIGPMSSGFPLQEQKRKISTIQIKSILRNRKTAKDLDKSTTFFSLILMLFAAVQTIVVSLQFILQASEYENKFLSYPFLISYGVIIFLLGKWFNPILDKMSRKKE